MNPQHHRPLHPTLLPAVMFVIAFVQFAVGPAVPAISQAMDIPESGLGIIFTAQFLGACSALLIASRAGHHVSQRSMLAGSFLVYLLAAACVPFMTTVGSLSAALAFLGAASANTQVTIFALVETIYGTQSSKQQNLVGASFAAGAVIGPMAFGIAVTHIGWGTVFWLGAIAGVPFLIRLFSAPLCEHAPLPTVPRPAIPRWFPLLTTGLVFYLAAESIFNSWLATYTKEVLAAEPFWQGASTAIFWLGIAVGRLINSRLVQRYPLQRLIVWYSASTIVVGLAALHSGSVPVGLVLFGLTGVSMSGLAPALISTQGQQPNGEQYMYLFFAVGQLGLAVYPYVGAKVAAASGFYYTFLLPAPALAAMLVTLRLFFRRHQVHTLPER